MNEFLESLEIGDEKIKLPKDIIKSIMAEHGKRITTETDKIKKDYEEKVSSRDTTITDLKAQLEKAPKSEDLDKLKDTIATYEKNENERIENEKKAQQEQMLLKNINEAIGDKKFVNEYTKNSIVNEIKTALGNEANAGKSAKDLFDSITKDKQDIFANPNQITNMTGMGDIDGNGAKTKSEGIKLNPMFKNFN